jgi:hypothetical protein
MGTLTQGKLNMIYKLNTTSPIHDDLVNNFQLFHKEHSSIQLDKLPNWKDNSNYSNYMHIDSFFADLNARIKNKENVVDVLERQHILAIPINYIFSSDGTNGKGYDRPIYASTKGVEQCYHNMNVPGEDGKPKGYVAEDAMVLSAWLRWDSKSNEWQVVKNMGNNRIVMKLLANRGVDTEVLVYIRFHSPDSTQDKCIQIEAESHSTDAGDRSGQNESQKFCSALRGERPLTIECYNFLYDNEISYGDMMPGKEGWLKITSLQGLKDGTSNGYFKKYGKTRKGTSTKNVEWALRTIKDIAKITKEKYIGSSPLESFTQMYHCFTDYGKAEGSDPLFSEEELHDFFIEFFRVKNPEKKENSTSNCFGDKTPTFKLKELNQSGAMKSITYINAMTFWPLITEYWKCTVAPLRPSHNGKQSFGIGSLAVQKFLNCCKDPLIKHHIQSQVL